MAMMMHNINVLSYFRYKLLKERTAKDDSIEREVMLEIEKAFKCENLDSLFKAVDNYIDRIVEALAEQGYVVIYDARLGLKTRFVMRPRSGLLSIDWDPYWNLPYVPAKAIADALNSANMFFSRCPGGFGTLEDASSIVVLDAYPILCQYGRSLVKVDYLEEEEGITELDNIKQTPMLTISSGTALRVTLLSKRPDICPEEHLLRLVSVALRRGVGALTPLGYGTFDMRSL